MLIKIIDDDPVFAQKINDVICHCLDNIFMNYSIEIMTKDFKYENGDIYFLDIDLKEKNGIQFAEEIKNNNSNAIIIFVSVMNNMIFESLVVQPFYFVRKDNFDKDMKIACALIQKYINKNHKIITFDFKGRKTAIKLSDIIFLESFLHEITIHTSSNSYKCSSTFNNIMNQINSTNIIRIHKSYAVNLFWVKEISKGEIIMRDRTVLKIGKKYIKDVIVSYEEYLLRLYIYFWIT